MSWEFVDQAGREILMVRRRDFIALAGGAVASGVRGGFRHCRHPKTCTGAAVSNCNKSETTASARSCHERLFWVKWRALPQDVELMLEHHDFSFKPSSEFEAVAQHAHEQEGNCEHPSIMF